MLFTRESDYALRILRVLTTEVRMTVQAISFKEDIPFQMTYKAAKKLERAGYIESFQGAKGGYELRADVKQVSLYDVLLVMDQDVFLTKCIDENFQCSRNPEEKPCKVHIEFCRIQEILARELQAKSLAKILRK